MVVESDRLSERSSIVYSLKLRSEEKKNEFKK